MTDHLHEPTPYLIQYREAESVCFPTFPIRWLAD